jgi:hypothetical protein
LKGVDKNDEPVSARISELQKEEDSAFNIVKYVERITLLLIIAGMGLLIALAWRNF